MNGSLLATKFFIPPRRLMSVERADLCRRLNKELLVDGGFSRKLTLVSAPPGFGKTTLASEWLQALPFAKAWLSLDEKDNDPARFLTYLVSALQTAEPNFGIWVLDALQALQSPSIDTLLVRLVNDLAESGSRLILALDDYHVINSAVVDGIIAFLIDNLPLRVHLVLITREDPGLPLARYRARGQMQELRAGDLKFSYLEVMDFYSRVMGIPLAESDISALEARTEGWVAGLQFAALALQGNSGEKARTEFISSFTGSHRFVLDYLVEEVLSQRSETVQTFLLATSCLGRFCGALCDAILESPDGAGRATLEVLDRANLFMIPLDGERRWYRYHHLFAELLQQRLTALPHPSCPAPSLIHSRASAWFEQNDLVVEAFRHAAASGNVALAEAFIDDRRMPTHTRDAMKEVIDWLTALPESVKNDRPSLWVKFAGYSLISGTTTGVEESLQAAESALRGREATERLLFGQIATARATLAVSHYHIEDAKIQARHALELLEAYDSTFALAALWDLGMAHLFAGERAEARRILQEVLSASRSCNAVNFQIISTLGLGEIQEKDRQLFMAAGTFQNVIRISGEHPQPNICVAYQGLARIHFEWNDLENAWAFAERGLLLALQYDSSIDMFVACEVLLARLETALGNLESAGERLDKAKQTVLQNRFPHRLPEIRVAQALLQFRRGHIPDAEGLPAPLRIKFFLAKGMLEEATALLNSWTAELDNHEDERLQALVLRVAVQEENGNHDSALATLESALTLAEPGGFIRLFVDGGSTIQQLVRQIHSLGKLPDYTSRIVAAFSDAGTGTVGKAITARSAGTNTARDSRELLSGREHEVLLEIALGLSNQDIAEKLFISLLTVKVHVRNIFAKLETASRTAAVAKARSLGILP